MSDEQTRWVIPHSFLLVQKRNLPRKKMETEVEYFGYRPPVYTWRPGIFFFPWVGRVKGKMEILWTGKKPKQTILEKVFKTWMLLAVEESGEAKRLLWEGFMTRCVAPLDVSKGLAAFVCRVMEGLALADHEAAPGPGFTKPLRSVYFQPKMLS